MKNKLFIAIQPIFSIVINKLFIAIQPIFSIGSIAINKLLKSTNNRAINSLFFLIISNLLISYFKLFLHTG